MPCVVKDEFEVQYQRYSCTLACFHMVVKALPRYDYVQKGCTSACFHMVVKEKSQMKV